MNWTNILVLVLISFLKGGSSPSDSLIGVIKCDHVDWVLFFTLQFFCAIFLILGLVVLKREYKEKVEAGYNFIEGDLQATTYNIVVMVTVGMISGIYASFSGIGAGMIFIPALIMIGIESQVAAATGMYLSMFSTLSSTIQLIAHNRVDLEYSIYVQSMTVFGTFIGIFF